MALLISLEGGEGSGKSTLAGALADRLRAAGADVVLTREPGGTPRGLELRRILFAEEAQLDPWTETFLYLADRSIHVAEVIRPALARGAIVISDRFADSTLAYQGYGRQLDVELVATLNHKATGDLQPTLTLLLDIPVREGLARAVAESSDRLGHEDLDFHLRVGEGFHRIAMTEPERIHLLNATASLADVEDAAWAQLEPRLRSHGVPLD